ncbi:MAG: PAS domain-containing protein [Deltaproteobacteria bacterium]|nr:PAS domain-containing protein [Deltaproteobacteria bacterium]
MDEGEKTDILRVVFDALPSLVFVVDQDVRIQEYNAAASDLLMAKRATVLKQRAGEILHCVHSRAVPDGCGEAPFCKNCIIRNSVKEAFQGNRVVRRRTRLELMRDGNTLEIYALITASPFSFQDRPLALLVIEDISEIAELYRMIPICSICKKIRDEKESWMRVETYFKNNWGVDFSHGICPDCYKIEKGKLESYIKTEQDTSS